MHVLWLLIFSLRFASSYTSGKAQWTTMKPYIRPLLRFLLRYGNSLQPFTRCRPRSRHPKWYVDRVTKDTIQFMTSAKAEGSDGRSLISLPSFYMRSLLKSVSFQRLKLTTISLHASKSSALTTRRGQQSHPAPTTQERFPPSLCFPSLKRRLCTSKNKHENPHDLHQITRHTWPRSFLPILSPPLPSR